MRPKYQTRAVRLVAETQREVAQAMLSNAPIDPEHPIEFLLREEVKARTLDQNAGMWSGPLRDIAEQAWVNGRQFAAEIWAEHLKQEFLPEDDDPDLVVLVKPPETYRKWALTPRGGRILTGSTTQLTERGFALYRLRVEAWASNEGVELHAAPARSCA